MEIYKVIETYRFTLQSNGLEVSGELLEALQGSDSQRYYWSISHHYQGADGAKPYRPSNISGSTLDEVRDGLMSYASGFDSAFAIVKD